MQNSESIADHVERRTVEFATVMRQAKAALDLLQQLRVPPTLPRYTVSYLHHTGEMPGLSAALSKLLTEKKLDQAAFDQLYEKFLGDIAKETELRETSQRIERSIAGVINQLDVTNDAVSRYGTVLKDFRLKTHELALVDDGIAVVCHETQAMEITNRRLGKYLRDSSQEMRLLREHMEELERQANIDSLTGIANRNRFDIALREEISRATEGRQRLSVLMIDIDHFKDFNDMHGHQLGDQVLKLVARYITECTRGSDLVARYGGEEFAVLLPRTALRAGTRVAENIRRHVSAKRVVNRRTGDDLGRIFLSIGVAEYRVGEGVAEVLRRADEALYLAKAKGRNCVVSEAEIRAPIGQSAEPR
jgi:diguanylate cyclase